jgi:hypothetical protein
MAVTADDLRTAAFAIERSWSSFNCGLEEFRNACQRGDEVHAERKRLQVMTALEGFLDNVAIAHRLTNLNAPG